MDLGLLIAATQVSSIAATSITAPDALQNSRWGASHFSSRNSLIYRPEATSAADYIRPANDLTPTTGVLSHGGANYSDTTSTDEDIEIWYDNLRPDKEFKDAVNRALEFVFFKTFVPLSHLSNLDGDMAASTDTNWTDVGTPTTSEKATTAAYTPYGIRSYHLAGNAADEGTRSASLTVQKERQITAFTIASAVTGSVEFQPYDVTNSAVIGTATTSDERHPMFMKWAGAVPDTCEQVANYHVAPESSSDFYLNGSWLYIHDNLRINFPSYLTEQFMANSIFYARPKYGGSASNTWDAQGVEMVRLTEGKDYDLIIHHQDANPTGVIFRDNSVFQYPLFVETRRPYSDIGTLSAESDSTNAPLHQLLPAIKLELLTSTLLLRDPENPKWKTVYARAQQEWNAANVVRATKKVAHRPVFNGIMRA